MELVGPQSDIHMPGIVRYRVEIGLLIDSMETEPKPEAIRVRHLLIYRLACMKGGSLLILDHIEGQQVPPVKCGVENCVVRSPRHTAI